MAGYRTLPFHVAPVAGESLESWLAALAVRMHASWEELIAAVLPATGDLHAPNTLGFQPGLLSDADLGNICLTTGIDRRTLDSLTIAGQTRDYLTLDIRTGHAYTPWGRISRQRFCPRCLNSNGGRWMLAWQLPWVFACARHHCLLADTCPRCDQHQSAAAVRAHPSAEPRPTCCGRMHGPTGARTYCSSPLSGAKTLTLSAHGPALRTQSTLIELLRRKTISTGIYCTDPITPTQLLVDIRTLLFRILHSAPAADLARIVAVEGTPADLKAWTRQLRSDRGDERALHSPGFDLGTPAASVGAGLTVALTIVSDSLEGAGAALRHYGRDIGRPRTQYITPFSTWREHAPTPQLCAVEVINRSPGFTPLEELRYRRHSCLPAYPLSMSASRTDHMADLIPTMLWQNWALCLVPPHARGWSAIRQVLSVLLVYVGTLATERITVERLATTLETSNMARYVREFSTSEAWPAFAEALIRLNRELRCRPPPIDFRRRRSLDYSDLLPHREWSEFCALGGMRPTMTSLAVEARGWLFERVSGMPRQSAPFSDQFPAGCEARDSLHVHLTAEFMAECDRRAVNFLAAQGVCDEPITWTPSLKIVNDLDLPGVELSSISSPLLRQIRTERVPIAHVARQRGIPKEAVYHVLESAPGPRPAKTHFEQAMMSVDRRTFEKLHVQQGRTLVEIAERYKLSTVALSRLARFYDIPVRQHAVDVDPKWLRYQHMHCRRPYSDLARELGVSDWKVLDTARRNGIPIRKYRKPRHSLLIAVSEVPSAAILAPALSTCLGWCRLTRFALCTEHRSLKQLAHAIGCPVESLPKQIDRLEKDLGKRLLVRGLTVSADYTITRFGHRVANAVREVQCRLAASETE